MLRLTTTLLIILLASTTHAQPWPVRDSTNTYGYVNAEGKVVVPFKYKHASGFVNGLAAVTEHKQYHLIDTLGNIRHSFADSLIVVPLRDSLWKFEATSNNFHPNRKRQGVMTMSGRVVVPLNKW